MNTFTILAFFALAMIGLSAWSRRPDIGNNIEEFVVASRDLGFLRGACSIAISWVWAPAIFIASLQAYTQGLAGAFWFIVPNILCFFLFAQVAQRLRAQMPQGITLPQYIKQKFGSTRLHAAFLVIFLGYQLGAIIINGVAGGTLISLLTGIDFQWAVGILSLTALVYSLAGGMRASVLTDVVQMFMVLGLALFIVPWVIIQAGGISSISGGLGGVEGVGASILNPQIAWVFGIPMTISLLAGPLGDQQFFQRAFAVQQDKIIQTFNWGGLIFGLVPILLCTLGFIAANPTFSIEVSDPQMVAPMVIAYFVPEWVLGLFTLMAFAGLCSTIDSAYMAISSFAVADLYHTENTQSTKIKKARWVMVFFGIIGTVFALMQPEMLWIFLIYGTIVAISFVPTLASILYTQYTEKMAFWSIVLGLCIAFPLSVYANFSHNPNLVVIASILSVGIGAMVSGGMIFFQKCKSYQSH